MILKVTEALAGQTSRVDQEALADQEALNEEKRSHRSGSTGMSHSFGSHLRDSGGGVRVTPHSLGASASTLSIYF